VFDNRRNGVDQVSLRRAIDALSKTHAVDLINISMGSPQPSEIVHDAIIAAFERGSVCVCAAGNSADAVKWPAAFSECVAVSALGRKSLGSGNGAPAWLPRSRNRIGKNGLYLASFSCYGKEIFCAGPGVGIISTVPPQRGMRAPFAAKDGTSMASPAVCAATAVDLAASAKCKKMARNEAKSVMIKKLLASGCRNLGLHIKFQGHGLPNTASAQSGQRYEFER
jgi:subtilisin